MLDPCNKSSSLPAQPSSSPASLRAQSGISEVPLACQAPPATGGVPWSWETKGFAIKASEQEGKRKEKRHQKVFPRSGLAGKELWGFLASFTGYGNGDVSQILLSPFLVGRGRWNLILWDTDLPFWAVLSLPGFQEKRFDFGVEKSGLNSVGEAEGREQIGILILYSQSHSSFLTEWVLRRLRGKKFHSRSL